MLRVLQGAYTEVNVKPEDWAMLDQEVNANLQKGVSQPQQGVPRGQQPQGGGQAAAMMEQAKRLPPDKQQEVMAMSNSGAEPQKILQFIQQQTGAR
jgi:hypothetical protein